jgi:hypothetical protein
VGEYVNWWVGCARRTNVAHLQLDDQQTIGTTGAT